MLLKSDVDKIDDYKKWPGQWSVYPNSDRVHLNIFSLPAPVVISMTNCVSRGFGDTITWDELYGAILCLLGCFLHVLKQIAIYFSCLADCCNSVSPRSSGNVSRTTNLLLIVILGELLLSEHEFKRKSKWLYIMFQIIMRRKTNLQMMLTCR